MKALGRRPFLASLLAFAGLGILAGGGYEARRLFGRRYPPTPYDDLLDQLSDRDSAATLGAAVLAQAPGLNRSGIASALRRRGPLSQSVRADLAHGQLKVVGGWVLPEAAAQAAGLARLEAPPPG